MCVWTETPALFAHGTKETVSSTVPAICSLSIFTTRNSTWRSSLHLCPTYG